MKTSFWQDFTLALKSNFSIPILLLFVLISKLLFLHPNISPIENDIAFFLQNLNLQSLPIYSLSLKASSLAELVLTWNFELLGFSLLRLNAMLFVLIAIAGIFSLIKKLSRDAIASFIATLLILSDFSISLLSTNVSSSAVSYFFLIAFFISVFNVHNLNSRFLLSTFYLFFAVMSDYSLLSFLPIMFVVYAMNDEKKPNLFVAVNLLLLSAYFIIFQNELSKVVFLYHSISFDVIHSTKNLLEILRLVLLPTVLFLFSYRYKNEFGFAPIASASFAAVAIYLTLIFALLPLTSIFLYAAVINTLLLVFSGKALKYGLIQNKIYKTHVIAFILFFALSNFYMLFNYNFSQ